ncbi:hypothetical protein GYMLUDRAFT_251474 [Collybiopsis luxurians FD-317 M1]|uniref:Uncharacterized protein n=1 Tax=Collybiopsis luxurians FD-317 M1 TaxID=944289 RepID=A0A0D0BCF4_9AGAR|nr:hypothetical protein GYMLUDRAFT_251474 [Collybiopsis luxurians FD-317 M1]
MRLSAISVTLALALFVAAAPVDQPKAGEVLRRTSPKSSSKPPPAPKTGSSSSKPPTTPKTGSSSSKPPTTPKTGSSSSKPPTTPKTGSSSSKPPTTPKTGSSSTTPKKGSTTSGKTCPALSTIAGGKTSKTATTSKTSKTAQKQKRAGVTHPPGKSNVALFHGTESKSDAAKLKGTVNLSVIKDGDLHSTAVPGVDGGFYLTDSLLAAAQFACRKLEPTAYVLEYQWNGASLPVKDYQAGTEWSAFLDYEKHGDAATRNAALDQVMKDNDMISGPMNAPGADDYLSKWFWQYAVIKQTASTSSLKYQKTYEIPCSAIPIGDDLTDELYSAGQKTSPHFNAMATQLTECESGPYDWHKAISG